eukprot:g11799.t1
MVRAAGCAAALGCAVPLLLLTNVTGFLSPLSARTAAVGKHRHDVGGIPPRLTSSSYPRSAGAAVGAMRGVAMASSRRPGAKSKEELFWLEEERDACGVGFIANPKPEHKVVELGLAALGCMEHRGACLADNVSGDGSGIMTSVPWALLEREYSKMGVEVGSLPSRDQRAVGMVFMPQGEDDADVCRSVIEKIMTQAGLAFHGWRTVPVDASSLGPQSRENQPMIEQFMVSSETTAGDALEREMYLLRRMAAKLLVDRGLNWQKDMYFCSLSSRTIVYKGMTNANALGIFYKDLKDPEYATTFCVYHRRFSTNTMPKWPLAQPMRMLGHNGEINTLLGNINWVRAREGGLDTECEFDPEGDTRNFINNCDIQDDETFEALVDNGKSDSANLDSVVELLVQSSKSPVEALMIMVPEAFRSQPALNGRPEIKEFYQFWEGHQEAWDGPALLVWSDGKRVGACLDRNGLRPARYMTLKDGTVLMMSETGVVPVDETEVVSKGRLGPGQMIACDLVNGGFEDNWSIKQKVAAGRPYGEWMKQHAKRVGPQPFTAEDVAKDDLLVPHTYFGWSSEDVDMQIADMAKTGKESTFCMGDDIPLAVMSEQPHVLYDYFKQRFAQVTNPPIDPLREGMVMSLEMSLGPRGNVMNPKAEDARQIKIPSPVLNAGELKAIQEVPGFKTTMLATVYPLEQGPGGLEAAVEALTSAAVKAVTDGADVIVLSDKTDQGLSPDETYIPPLLAVGATHHALIEAGVRMKASIVVETGQAWSTHHFACLVGYGASAVHPYLAYQSVLGWWSKAAVQKQMEKGVLPQVSAEQAQQNFRVAIESGVLKIMSKMGISLLSSYQGAQIFEAIGIGEDLLHLGFRGTPSRLGGLETHDLACETASFMEKAFGDEGLKKLANYGYVQFFRSGEYHHNSPLLMKTLHKAIRAEDYSMYDLYMQALRSRPVTTLRDLLDFSGPGRREAIPLEEVEPAENIMRRFCTGGMSLGALSREAHETLAVALNRIGGKSNSGEGGEDPIRFRPIEDVSAENGESTSFPHLKELRNGDLAASAIKQVASGRFGVTPEYLVSAEQIEIKMAQGAKPGEGGQLPGPKISEYIASLRASKPGVTLISPPPHHDIYSIEDLSQLIFDLHQINPAAGVSVKLVSEVGIGTVAAGVAKANADVIQVSGHDGGTGASPLSSIKHAGSPWELGLAEVHRTLLENKLRDRVLLRTDGGIKTGWDVVIAALMGAEEYGFGTIAMIAEGCIMARICHTNNCPVGVTTQKEELRKKFPGTPQNVVTFFEFVAEEVRLLLAELGFKSLDEAIGRADVLSARTDVPLAKTNGMLDLDFITNLPDVSEDRSWLEHGKAHGNGPVLDDEILADPAVKACIEEGSKLTREYPIANTDRSVGGRLSGSIADQWGNKGFESAGGDLELRFKGSAGQTFGAFNLPGVSLHLEGEANDYVGKGLNGGQIVIVPNSAAKYDASENVIIGNTCLYGATGGALYVNGRAGERFAVRNSMADSVVEGTGDHCCEYMTGGNVVVLGTVGRNVGAGMTGGVAYILDEFPEGEFMEHINLEIVKAQRVSTPEGEAIVKGMIEKHAELTGSPKAKQVLANWEKNLPRFWQLVPPAEANIAATNPSVSEAAAPAATGVKSDEALPVA